MMKRGRVVHGVHAMFVAVVTAAASGTAAAETLQDAWQLAISRDNVLAAASSDVEGARASEQAARGARWPSVQASAGYTRLNASPSLDVATSGSTFRSGPIFRGNEYVAGSVQMKVPLYAGGQISAGIDAAHNVFVGATEDQQATISALKLDVAEAYVSVLRARRTLHAAESSVTSLSAHAGDVQHLVDRELVPRSDALAAHVALANAQQVRVRAENSVEITQAQYNRRLGEPLGRAPELDDRIPVDVSLSAEPIEALLRQALASRSELKGLAARADSLT